MISILKTTRQMTSDLTPKKRAVIAQGLFSYQIGGSERVGAELAIEFQRRGHQVICFGLYDTNGPIRGELEQAGIECVDLNYETRLSPLRRLTYGIEFYRFLRNRRVDGLLLHHATALILCGIAARLARTPRVVMTEHAIHQLRERPDYRRTATRYCRYADVITAVDPGIADYFRDEMHVPAERLVYIANGVRVRTATAEQRAAMRTACGVGPENFVFLFVGRLQPVKDVGTLLQAFALLSRETRQRARLLIAGDGPERAALTALAASLGIAAEVNFLGPRGDIPQLLTAADAFVMTSVTEGQPMALIEAMAARLPCIATSVGGIPALLDDRAGLLTPPSSPPATAAAMQQLMDSATLREECVTQAMRKIEARHSLERVVDAYLEALGVEAPRAAT
jgi:glycosyltransferase involved in cell wall biosynthesis